MGSCFVQSAAPNQNKSLPRPALDHPSPRQHEPAPKFSSQACLKSRSAQTCSDRYNYKRRHLSTIYKAEASELDQHLGHGHYFSRQRSDRSLRAPSRAPTPLNGASVLSSTLHCASEPEVRWIETRCRISAFGCCPPRALFAVSLSFASRDVDVQCCVPLMSPLMPYSCANDAPPRASRPPNGIVPTRGLPPPRCLARSAPALDRTCPHNRIMD